MKKYALVSAVLLALAIMWGCASVPTQAPGWPQKVAVEGGVISGQATETSGIQRHPLCQGACRCPLRWKRPSRRSPGTEFSDHRIWRCVPPAGSPGHTMKQAKRSEDCLYLNVYDREECR